MGDCDVPLNPLQVPEEAQVTAPGSGFWRESHQSAPESSWLPFCRAIEEVSFTVGKGFVGISGRGDVPAVIFPGRNVMTVASSVAVIEAMSAVCWSDSRLQQTR